MLVEKGGNPKLEFLDENGAVVQSFPNSSKTIPKNQD
jgi:hypothetical protein